MEAWNCDTWKLVEGDTWNIIIGALHMEAYKNRDTWCDIIEWLIMVTGHEVNDDGIPKNYYFIRQFSKGRILQAP